MSVHLFTFCVDIEKHTRDDLRKVLHLLVSSLDKNVIDYELIVYTNFDLRFEHKSVKIRDYYDNTPSTRIETGGIINCHGDGCNEKSSEIDFKGREAEVSFCRKCFPPLGFIKFKSKWYNLSFNKINLYNDLYHETGIDYVWIDLDTYVATDISYVKNLKTFFIENGGECEVKWPLFMERTDYFVPTCKYIQGNIWKLNRTHYTNIMNLYKELIENKMYPQFDLQDIFNYYVHYKKVNVPVLGSLNGLAIWYDNEHTGPNEKALKEFFYDQDNILRVSYRPDEEIHFVSFTMENLLSLWENEDFKRLFLN